MGKLTKQQFELLQKFLPQSKTMKWDIEAIGAIRDAIREQIVDRQKAMSEERSYPYLKIWNLKLESRKSKTR